jgi:hypothetical protein
MKIRFFDKKTGKDMPAQKNYLVDNLGQVFENCFNQWDDKQNIEDRPGLGWEILESDEKEDVQICYVAVDPSYPGAVFGLVFDNPCSDKEDKEMLTQEISDWIKKGFNVERLSCDKSGKILKK